jgi:RHS repeat-associated protein
MPVCEQEFKDGVLRTTRVNFLGARGIEAVLTIDHTRGNRASLSWLLYDGHGNLMRTMAPNYTLSAFQWRGVWGEVQGSLGTGRGYCANLGHPEDETGLVYMRARYYEPATGRFISEDPARDGVNWYLYADGNPVNKVDITGKEPTDDSFDPVYAWLDKWTIEIFGRRVFLFDMLINNAAFSAIRAYAMAIAALMFGSPRLAVGAAISYASAVGLTVWLGLDVTLMYSARLAAWYVFLFPDEI